MVDHHDLRAPYLDDFNLISHVIDSRCLLNKLPFIEAHVQTTLCLIVDTNGLNGKGNRENI